MTAERHFLGWDRPLLPRAAGWLRERYGGAAGGGGADLSEVLVVVPTARAGRRLMELLVSGAGDRGLLPPTIVTPGSLPERLYRCDDTADSLMCLLARVKVLRDLPPEKVQRLTGDPPGAEDLRGWWGLASELSELADVLAADGVTVGEVVEATGDPARWVVLAEIEEACRACLAEQGLVDCAEARRRALVGEGEGGCRAPGPIVLVGVADLNRLTRRFLERVAGDVTALIGAPAGEAGAFDAFGALVVDAWADRDVAVADERWVVADRPSDQARAVLEAVAAASRAREGAREGGARLSADQVTVGLGDESLGPAVERVLRLSGVPARRAAGMTVGRTRPALLLGAVGRYLRTRRFDDFAALVRHPDVPAAGRGVGDWLTLLDRYATEHLQGRVTGAWLGEAAPRLKGVYDAVHGLLPEGAGEERPLPAWAGPIAGMLEGFYARTTLRRGDAADAAMIAGLECLREALERLAGLDGAGVCTPDVNLAGAIALVLELAGVGVVPGLGADEPAVEVVGFLELPLDDADVLVVTGLNEGAVPSGVGADALLPGKLRAKLGVSDNRRRLARDLYALTSLLHREADVTLISGRHGAGGEPLAPSRLLLRCEPGRMAARLRRFYEESGAGGSPRRLLLTPGVEAGRPSAFHVPRPSTNGSTPRLERLRVTAFRDYLACPYRFYLRHVLRLTGSDDEAVEMSGGHFGTLAHRVLSAFGRSDLRDETHARAIEAFLETALDAEVRAWFGPEPGAAVVLQREQLRERLGAFAQWQAEQVRAGWRIVPERVECRCEAALEVDGEPFTIRGDIDRVDRHPDLGWRIIDYKTQDRGDDPEETHRSGPKSDRQWTDLQLPLYRELARGLGCGGVIELGYVSLPRDVGGVGWLPAGWSEAELDGAVERAREIVRQVRAGVFWPPSDPPAYEDDYVGVCFDRIIDRAAAIAGAGEGNRKP